MITTPLLSHWPQEAWGNQDFGILAPTCVGYEDVAFWADAVASYASCINSGKVILSRASPHHSHTHPHHGIQSTSFFFFFFSFSFTYFFAVLGLCCCMDFSLAAASRGYPPAAVHRLLTVVASLVADHGL